MEASIVEATRWPSLAWCALVQLRARFTMQQVRAKLSLHLSHLVVCCCGHLILSALSSLLPVNDVVMRIGGLIGC